ncbi:unnamed protein product [Caenorhabditis brenneri]
MVLKSEKRYHLAVEMLKWRSYKEPKLVGNVGCSTASGIRNTERFTGGAETGVHETHLLQNTMLHENNIKKEKVSSIGKVIEYLVIEKRGLFLRESSNGIRAINFRVRVENIPRRESNVRILPPLAHFLNTYHIKQLHFLHCGLLNGRALHKLGELISSRPIRVDRLDACRGYEEAFPSKGEDYFNRMCRKPVGNPAHGLRQEGKPRIIPDAELKRQKLHNIVRINVKINKSGFLYELQTLSKCHKDDVDPRSEHQSTTGPYGPKFGSQSLKTGFNGPKTRFHRFKNGTNGPKIGSNGPKIGLKGQNYEGIWKRRSASMQSSTNRNITVRKRARHTEDAPTSGQVASQVNPQNASTTTQNPCQSKSGQTSNMDKDSEIEDL